jgi:poly-gamma-glutamate synthesis protein (capsule biosynthesis protein)
VNPRALVASLSALALGALAVPAVRADEPITDTPAVAQRLAPPMRSFTLLGVGDLLTEAPVNRAAAASAPVGARYDFAPLFAPIADIVRAADLAICHMEIPITAPGGKVGWVGKSPYGPNLLAAPHEVAGGLAATGFDRCSTASNHSWDLGAEGVRTTLEALDGAGIGHAGTARSPAEAGVHVFEEMQKAPHPTDRALVTAIAAQAAPEVVLVTGPHVPQPMERVGGTLVWWSLGNLISGMGVPNRGKYSDPRSLDGLMATVRLTERADHTWSAEPSTVLLCNPISDRRVYPGLTARSDPALSASLRAQLQACAQRSAWLPTTLS